VNGIAGGGSRRRSAVGYFGRREDEVWWCNALNLGVEFFSSFLSPNSGVTLFSLSPFAPSSQFQTSITTCVRVMYKPKPKCHGCCIMPKHISFSDVECSSRSVPDFDSRFKFV
jgi:hypothetical protein